MNRICQMALSLSHNDKRGATQHISTLVVERTERDVHVAEKGDDFIDQFHDGVLISESVIFVIHITKISLRFIF
ncbi:hypothetical protein [Kosakonia oryziphila]|uniref:hypothetical protein n=1 Tax=Kosakonia oryziphila TaxID=1005667 RepID=UPI001428B134|nr:hypothetical protein [Kosakonia oryziphila]